MPKMTGWRASLAALVLVSFVVGAQARSAPTDIRPWGCDPKRPGVAHHAGGKRIASPGRQRIVPCITVTFAGYGEANIVATSSGAVMHGGSYDTRPGGEGVSGGLARSVDKGSHWQYVTMPPGTFENTRGAGDPQLWRDPLTNRVWYTTIGGGIFPADTFLCDTNISYSDDNGATWTHHPDPPLWGCPAFDFPRPFTGPPRKSTIPKGRYPNIFYICKSHHTVPDRQCWKSLDSGASFTEIPNSGENSPWTADVKGIIYGASSGQLNISKDEGATWTHRALPAGFASLLGGGGPAVDRQGDIYLIAEINELPTVIFSRNQGARWSKPIAVQMPGVKHTHDATIAVGAPGHIAVAYLGNGDASDTPNIPPFQTGGVHHGFLTVTDDIFATRPVFRSVQVDSNADPLLPYGYPMLAGSSTSVSRADYIGVDVAPDGTPWAVYFKDRCSSPGLCGTTNTSKPFFNHFTNWMDAVATMTVQPAER